MVTGCFAFRAGAAWRSNPSSWITRSWWEWAISTPARRCSPLGSTRVAPPAWPYELPAGVVASGSRNAHRLLVSYDYRVPPAAESEFRAAMRDLRRSRLRLGGRRWRLERSPADPSLFVESYLVAGESEFAEQESSRLTVPETRLRLRVASLADEVAGPRFSVWTPAERGTRTDRYGLHRKSK